MEANTKICGAQQNIGLVLVFSEWQGYWDSWSNWKSVNERSNKDKTNIQAHD